MSSPPPECAALFYKGRLPVCDIRAKQEVWTFRVFYWQSQHDRGFKMLLGLKLWRSTDERDLCVT